MEVPGPNSKRANNFVRDFLQVGRTKELEKLYCKAVLNSNSPTLLTLSMITNMVSSGILL